MRKIKFKAFEISETQGIYTISGSFDDRFDYTDEEIRILINSLLESITGVKNDMGRLTYNVFIDQNGFTATSN